MKRTGVTDISGSDLAGLLSDFVEVTASDTTTLDNILSQTSAKNVAELLHDPGMIKFAIKKFAKSKLKPSTVEETSENHIITVCRHCGGVNDYSAENLLTT